MKIPNIKFILWNNFVNVARKRKAFTSCYGQKWNRYK